MSWLCSLFFRLTIYLLRIFVRCFGPIPTTCSPDEVLYIKSRDPQRSIKIHVYRPSTNVSQKPSPVLINLTGSGFVLPGHGSDDGFCRQISQQTGYTVLDIEYRLAPEHPFPAALNDVEDVVNWVLANGTDFDLSRISISGFSAGGNLALAASSCIFPSTTFSSVLAFYPAVELFTKPKVLTAPDPNGSNVPAFMLRLFYKCYTLSGFDVRDPRISPAFADVDSFPRRVLIVTGGYDTMAIDAENLASRLHETPGRKVFCERMERCNHAWDKTAQRGTFEWEAKERAYRLAEGMLMDAN